MFIIECLKFMKKNSIIGIYMVRILLFMLVEIIVLIMFSEII